MHNVIGSTVEPNWLARLSSQQSTIHDPRSTSEQSKVGQAGGRRSPQYLNLGSRSMFTHSYTLCFDRWQYLVMYPHPPLYLHIPGQRQYLCVIASSKKYQPHHKRRNHVGGLSCRCRCRCKAARGVQEETEEKCVYRRSWLSQCWILAHP
ncbi:hypothetical protein B0F90DRAFT_1159629 [Multifurca ochricompacta]|uniref:Uncharacterized protein n=1 Tax=Multifurca ochricompacta TaxID=376703 RepID=A0AAD4M9T6_9AGAM|nr:hypothetical protein B0F90DRAFT_1159629 [Multifurca ochricompacta]